MTSPGSAIDDCFQLLDRRSAVLARSLERVKEWSGRSEGELLTAITTADRTNRPLLGLLLARAILQKAALAGNTTSLDNFLFRFGMHLRTSVGVAGGSTDAVVVAMASRACLLRTRAAEQVAQIDEVLARLPEVQNKDEAWRRQLGVSKTQFEGLLDSVAGTVATGRAAERRVANRKTATTPPPPVPASASAPQEVPIPQWLGTEMSQQLEDNASLHVAATRSWHLSREGTSTPNPDAWQDLLASAWQSHSEGRNAASAAFLAPLTDTCGWAWLPSAAPDGLRFWNWLRLVTTTGRIEEGLARNRRRALVSAVEAANRSVPDNEELVDNLLNQAVEDFLTVEPQARKAWAVYLGRLVSVLGPDLPLARYDNDRKADLRAAWADLFGDLVAGCHQTHQMTSAIESEYKHALQAMRDSVKVADPHRAVVRPLRRLSVFLDEEEATLAAACEAVASRLTALLASERPVAQELLSLASQADALSDDIAAATSLLLQDALGPLVDEMKRALRGRIAALSSGSRPDCSAHLVTDRLPLSSRVLDPFNVEVRVRNDGNAVAEAVELVLAATGLKIESDTQVVQALQPGGVAVVRWSARVVAPTSDSLALFVRLVWRDALEQQFAADSAFTAEDHRAPSWQAGDVNPFDLRSISEPRRLVGRSVELAALERTVAGGGSAVVTGQKRVGKTSLVKVLQRSLQQDGWLVAYLPLGVSLSAIAKPADIFLAMFEALYDESVSVPELALPEPPTEADDEKFARAVGRWMRQAQAPFDQAGIKAVLALDDFDTLPLSLYKGPDADALFRTLRTLVDSSWLSLIFIGSEVLPTIMSSQAHQLNQVAPFLIDNFRKPEDTRELLLSRTQQRLDWDDDSFSRAHFLCNGSPYYLTLLGRDLWQHLRERDRSFVSPSDVDWALGEVARNGDTSHFLHLWADDATGLDNDARRSLLGSAALRAVALSSGTFYELVDRTQTTALAAQWIPSAQADEWSRTLNGLVDRNVLQEVGRQARLTIPLASSWLEEKGGRELDRVYAAAESARVATQMIADREIVDLTRDLTFCGERVSDLRLRAWLDQFEPGRPRYLAYLLARRLLSEGFYSAARISSEILPRMVTRLKATSAWSARQVDKEKYHKNVYILQHGMAASSSFSASSQLLALLRIRKANLVTQERYAKIAGLKKPSVLVIADDIVGTGTQIRGVTEALVDLLDADAAGWRESAHLVVAAGLSGQRALWTPDGVSCESVVAKDAAPRLLAFDESADLFADEADSSAAKELFATIGRALEPKDPLGFGGLALLAATENNCPNNTPPAFYKRGTHAGKEWLPLLERRV